MARVALAAHREPSVLFTGIDVSVAKTPRTESESIESIKIQIEPIIEDD